MSREDLQLLHALRVKIFLEPVELLLVSSNSALINFMFTFYFLVFVSHAVEGRIERSFSRFHDSLVVQEVTLELRECPLKIIKNVNLRSETGKRLSLGAQGFRHALKATVYSSSISRFNFGLLHDGLENVAHDLLNFCDGHVECHRIIDTIPLR